MCTERSSLLPNSDSQYGQGSFSSDICMVSSATIITLSDFGPVKSWGYRELAREAQHVWHHNMNSLAISLQSGMSQTIHDIILLVKYWARVGLHMLMVWLGGHKRFHLSCTVMPCGMCFFNHAKTTDRTRFLAQGTQKGGKDVLSSDRYTSAAVRVP